MTGLTAAERSEHRRAVFSDGEACVKCVQDWPCAVARLIDALEAAEQRTADLIAAVDQWVYRWYPGNVAALDDALAPFRTPPTIRTGDSTIVTDLAEQP